MLDLLRPIMGIIIFLGIGVLFSTARKQISLKAVGSALGFVFLFAFLVLFFDIGRTALKAVSDGVTTVLGFGKAGVDMLFGGLLTGEGIGFIFAFQVLPLIIFVSSLLAILYYFGIMQMVIRFIGGALAYVLGISKVEAMCAATNMFSAMSESMLFIRPYVPKLTQSELFCVIVVGLSSIGASTMIAYNLMGIPMEYILASVIMTAPSGLLMAKLFVPETEQLRYDQNSMQLQDEVKEASFLSAAASGAELGMKIVLSVAAMLMAFVSLIAMLDGFLGWIGGFIGVEDLSFAYITGYIFAPLAWILGADWGDATTVGSLIGTKIFVNEFVAFSQLGPMLGQGIISEHSEIIAMFSLCGFANIGSVSILIGMISTIAPTRKNEVVGFAFKSLIAATLANMLNGAVASFVVTLSQML